MVGKMLDHAWTRRRSQRALVIHSDQGWQYQMRPFRRKLEQQLVSQSMSRKGNCLDNAAMESFFATLKCEMFHQNCFTSVAHLSREIAQYIDYYNNERITLRLKGMSPVQYRAKFAPWKAA
jgi:transposase InsO family protein